MQGYILHTQKVRDEDLLVYILTPSLLVKSYRFYGARHSNVLQGYKIDFELEGGENFLPHLRSVLHLDYRWLLENPRWPSTRFSQRDNGRTNLRFRLLALFYFQEAAPI